MEEKRALAELEREDAGLVQRFRHIMQQWVHSFAHTPSAAPAQRRRHQRRQAIPVLEDRHLEKIPQCFAAHWEQALRSLRTKGMGKPRRGSNAESGRRLRRRLEKNPAGVRAAATRQYDIQISQASKSLFMDVADFLEKGPQLAEFPDV